MQWQSYDTSDQYIHAEVLVPMFMLVSDLLVVLLPSTSLILTRFFETTERDDENLISPTCALRIQWLKNFLRSSEKDHKYLVMKLLRYGRKPRSAKFLS